MQYSVKGVYHLYFGDATRHPIIGNYLRSLPELPQKIVLKNVPSSRYSRLWRVVRGVYRLRSHRSWALQCHDVVSAVVGTLLWRGRVIYDSHEIYASLATGMVSRFVASLERIAISRADIVVFPSDYRAAYYDVDRSKVRIVQNLFYPYGEHDSIGSRNHRGERDEAENRSLRFVYTGLFTPARAIDNIIAAFGHESLANCRLILAGQQTDYLAEVLSSATDNVEYVGELRHDAVCGLLETADAGFALYRPINENNRRCAPTKIFEFLYFGVHVIANESPYVAQIGDSVIEGCLTSISEISEVKIVEACLRVQERGTEVEAGVREVVCWNSQMSTLRSLYS